MLFFGATFVPMKTEEWSKRALGQDSRLATGLWVGAATLVYGALLALGIYIYYYLGLAVWAGMGRYWHAQFLMWRRLLGW